MDNYRNRYMHLPAGAAEEEWSTSLGDGTYGIAEAIGDMKEVSKYFLIVRDPSGVPYYDRICECEARYADDKNVRLYSIAEEMSSKAFKGYTEDDFVRACNELNIPVEKGDGGTLYYYTGDHEGDLRELKRQMSQNREANTGGHRKSALITGLCVAGAAIVAGLLIFSFAGRGNNSGVTGISAGEFQPSAYKTGDIDPGEAEKLVISMKEAAAGMSFDEYKQFYTLKYREDEALDDYIENDQKWLKGVSDCENCLFVPVVSGENVLGASVIFYGRQGDPEYKKARLFTFADEDGSLKTALEKIAAITKYTEDYPDGYNSAVSEKRNTYIADEADRSFKDPSAVLNGRETQECILAWAEPDGSVSLLIRLANGMSEAKEYSSVHVNLSAGFDSSSGNIILYDGDADLRKNGKPFVLEAGRGADYVVNIKKDSMAEGAAECDWSKLKVTLGSLSVL